MKGIWEEIHESNEDRVQTVGQCAGENQGRGEPGKERAERSLPELRTNIKH